MGAALKIKEGEVLGRRQAKTEAEETIELTALFSENRPAVTR
jgi:hypothetical protein